MRSASCLVSTLCAGAAVLSACGAERVCTAVATMSGVRVDYGDVRLHHPRNKVALEVCVDATCHAQKGGGPGAMVFVPFATDVMNRGDKATVRVTISTVRGRRLFDGATDLRPHREEVNGPGCGTTWVAHVIASGTSHVARAASD